MEGMTDTSTAAPAEGETPAPQNSGTASLTSNRSTTPGSDVFREFISSGWADRPRLTPEPREVAPLAAARRARIAAQFPGERLVLPAGQAKVRSNDTDHLYRPHSAFSHLTGWGSDAVAGSVLVIEADGEATLYFRATAGRDSSEFYANPAIGEFWTGPRPSLEDVSLDLGIATRPLEDLAAVIEACGAATRIVRDADPLLTDDVDGIRLLEGEEGGEEHGDPAERDAELVRALSELRLVKEPWEAEQLRLAVEATRRGFDDVIADLPHVVSHPRGERLVEGTFNRRARIEGNATGYETIAASGPHACILHWTRNDGPVAAGDLILIDAGVELDTLYTADITRTLPVSGRFTEVQRRVYEAVREAADAAFAVVRPGIRFREVHAAAMEVIARKTAEWGFLPVSAEESLDPDLQYHRRYMVHGTSHHLGLDVHDCAQARREFYHDGIVEAGMTFTIEPGLYFQPDDLTVPEEYRGIGVRIEDDILVTADGAENLSAGIPRTADEVEAWLAR